MSDKKEYTKEEIKAFVDEAIRKIKSGEKRELSPEELEDAAGGRTLATGEEVTEEVIRQYADYFRSINISLDLLIAFSDEMGFYPMDTKLLAQSTTDYDGAWIDCWVTLQKEKLRRESK